MQSDLSLELNLPTNDKATPPEEQIIRLFPVLSSLNLLYRGMEKGHCIGRLHLRSYILPNHAAKNRIPNMLYFAVSAKVVPAGHRCNPLSPGQEKGYMKCQQSK
jgi:hypothetical protein